jgi:hypothetical protein
MQQTGHQRDDHPDHQHGEGCGHTSVQHGDHLDYEHDGHRHAAHEGHWDEHGTGGGQAFTAPANVAGGSMSQRPADRPSGTSDLGGS